jgi:hypothetical protein
MPLAAIPGPSSKPNQILYRKGNENFNILAVNIAPQTLKYLETRK